MDIIRQGLLIVHLTAGVAALLLFWVPALTKKGGLQHRRAGRGYVYAMTTIVLTGVPLAALFVLKGKWVLGVFLLFLAVITGTTLWNGWRALRAKRGPAAYLTPVHKALAALNIVTGIGVMSLGWVKSVPLLMYFGPVGLLIGGGMVALLVRTPDDPKYWLYEHFGGMIGSGIASHVAFLVFGGRQLFGWGTAGAGVWLWVAPLVIGTVAITALNFYYRSKSAASRPVPA